MSEKLVLMLIITDSPGFRLGTKSSYPAKFSVLVNHFARLSDLVVRVPG
jgi:hypothetical protein